MKPTHLMIAAALLGMSVAASAHGNAPHHSGPVKKEQTAWGVAGDAAAASRTIEISMGDTMRFTPDRLQVKQGETVKIVVWNEGKMLHEFVMGSKKMLDEHAAMMMKFPDMEHDEPYMAHVKPGGSEEIVWTFNRAGSFDFACLIPGHYQAGMVGKIAVAAAGKSRSVAKTSAATQQSRP